MNCAVTRVLLRVGTLGAARDMDWGRDGDRRSWCTAQARGGWHRHHVLPRQLWRYPNLRVFVTGLHVFGLDLEDFTTNGLFLPATDELAQHYGLPLHRGAHRQYNDLVVDLLDTASRMNSTASGPFSASVIAVRRLQATIRTVLQMCALDTHVNLGGPDPFGNDKWISHLQQTAIEGFEAAFARTWLRPVHLEYAAKERLVAKKTCHCNKVVSESA